MWTNQLANLRNLFSGRCRPRPTATRTSRHSWTRLIDPTANRLQRAQATVFVRITCSYRFSPKSLLSKCLNTHFVFITQLTHHTVWRYRNSIIIIIIIKKTLTNNHKIVSLICHNRGDYSQGMTICDSSLFRVIGFL